MKEPRSPTLGEIKELQEWNDRTGIEDFIVSDYHIAVFDKYVSDCPGYVGKVMMVIWGDIDITDVFIWRDNKLTKVGDDE